MRGTVVLLHRQASSAQAFANCISVEKKFFEVGQAYHDGIVRSATWGLTLAEFSLAGLTVRWFGMSHLGSKITILHRQELVCLDGAQTSDVDVESQRCSR
jgi:hypothetical protein